jgi:hypothetical protein
VCVSFKSCSSHSIEFLAFGPEYEKDHSLKAVLSVDLMFVAALVSG